MVSTKEWNAAIGEQFPFLRPALRGLTQRAQVERVSPELLETTPREEVGTPASGYSTSETVQFWSASGENLGKLKPAVSHADAREMSGDDDGECIADALAGIDYTRVRVISWLSYESTSAVGSHPESLTLRIFRTAPGELESILAARKAAAVAAVAAASEVYTEVCIRCGGRVAVGDDVTLGPVEGRNASKDRQEAATIMVPNSGGTSGAIGYRAHKSCPPSPDAE